MGVVIFNGKSSSSFNAHLSEPPEYGIPEREFEAVHLRGRDGDFIIDTPNYQNLDVKYKMVIDASEGGYDYNDLASSIATWLHPWTDTGIDGYFKLSDTYDTAHYRLAKYKGGESISNIYNKAGQFDLTFNCKPQRFLKSGDVSISSGSSIDNPTSQISIPRITLKFTAAGGYLRIANSVHNYSCEIKSKVTGTIIVNSIIEDCYTPEGYNRNSSIEFHTGSNFNTVSYDFPKFYPGGNVISASNATFLITPYWWEL